MTQVRLAAHLPVPTTMDLSHPMAERYAETVAAADAWFGTVVERLQAIEADPRYTEEGKRRERLTFAADQAPRIPELFGRQRDEIARTRAADEAYLFGPLSGRTAPPEDGIEPEARIALEREARALLMPMERTDLQVMYHKACREGDTARIRLFEVAHPEVQERLGMDAETLATGRDLFARRDAERYGRWEAGGRVDRMLAWVEEEVGEAFDRLVGRAETKEAEPVVLDQ